MSLLKTARGAIDRKDYDEALRLSLEVLSSDPSNYNGLIFCGLCYENLERFSEGIEAYEKAISMNETRAHAYQGLYSLYEKQITSFKDPESIQATQKLAAKTKVQISQLKLNEGNVLNANLSLKKAIELYIQAHDAENAHKYLNERLKITKETDFYIESVKDYVQFVRDNPSHFDSEMLLRFIKEEKFDAEELILSTYLRHAAQDPENIIKVASIAMKSFPNERFGYESYFNASVQKLALKNVHFDASVFNQHDSPSDQTSLVQGAVLYMKKDFKNALETLKSIEDDKKKKSPHPDRSLLIARCYLELKDYSSSLNLIEGLLKNPYSSEYKVVLKELQIIALYYLYKISEIHFDEIEMQDNDELQIIKSNVDAYNGLASTNNSSLLCKGILCYTQKRYDECIPILSQYVETHFEAGCLLGQYYYDVSNTPEESRIYFLKSLSLNPANYIPYKYLGHLYRGFKSYDRSIKCYFKSYKLNPSSEEVIYALSDTLALVNEQEDQHFKFLELICNEGDGRLRDWARLRLGILHLNNQSTDKAIEYLQHVIYSESDHTTGYNAQEALGDAYILRGSYYSALRIFEEISTTYAKYKVGHIKYLMGEYNEAISTFESLPSNNSVLKYKGLSEAHLALAEQFFEEIIDADGVENASSALNYALIALKSNSDLVSLWKLAVKSIVILSEISETTIDKYFNIPKDFDRHDGSLRKYLYKLASYFATQGLKVNSKEHSLWHDLGLLSFLLQESQDDAIRSLKHAITLCPSNSTYWNTLGLVAYHGGQLAIAQHAFIKAVSLNASYSTAWTNLGILYLKQDNYRLANKSFQEAQNGDSRAGGAWAGQAILAQIVDSDELMDVLRHAALLGQEPHACYQYGKLIVGILQNASKKLKINSHESYVVDKLYGISSGADALEKFLRRYPNQPSAWNLYGILLEKLGRLSSASRAFLTEKDLTNKHSMNLARTYYKLNNYQSALLELHSLKNDDMKNDEVAFRSLNYYKSKQFKEAYGSYQESLSSASNTDDKSSILIGLGAIAHIVQGPSACQTLLNQAKTSNPSSNLPIYALTILGIKTRNVALILNSLASLTPCTNTILLQAIVQAFFQKKPHRAVVQLSKNVHSTPDVNELWRLINYITVMFNLRRGANNLTGLSAEDVLLKSSVEILKADERNKIALKFVHQFPHILEGRLLLVISMKKESSRIRESLKCLLADYKGPRKVQMEEWLSKH